MSTDTFITQEVPSIHAHPVYDKRAIVDGYEVDEERIPRGTSKNVEPGARIVSSQIVGTDSHTIMLDLDLPATLLPSSTSGHAHLFIDHPLTWRKYRRLLRALTKAGVIEEGYYRASIRRRHTALRIPGVKKEHK